MELTFLQHFVMGLFLLAVHGIAFYNGRAKESIIFRGVTTTLAAPTYEQTVIGLLYYTPDNVTSHCSPDAYSLQESDASTTLAKIVLVHRDRRCSLKKKVQSGARVRDQSNHGYG